MNWNILNPFSSGSKSTPKAETKNSSGWQNYNYGSSCNDSLINCLTGTGNSYKSISANVLWSWYRSVKPMRHAVEGIISQSFSSITPAIYDNKEGRFLNSGEEVDLSNFLKVFNNPNVFQSARKFKEAFAPSYFVTGTLYFIADIGVVSNEPVYLHYTPPQDVDPIEGNDGRVKWFSVTSNQRIEHFHRTETDDGEIVYYNKDETRELVQIANFNPCSDPLEGLSPLSSTLAEIEQYWQGNVHNNAFIAKGARPSGMIMIHPEMDLSHQQEESLRALVEKSTMGENTGKVLVAQGATNFKELSVNNKDMDYINLMERAKVETYTTLNVPLPMIVNKAMTLNNYQESKYMLYDGAIFPFAEMIYEEVNRFASKYYDTEDGRYEISFNKDEVDATKIRRNAETERLGNSGAITVNEHRDLLGYDPIPDGEFIYQPASNIPMGTSPIESQDSNEEKSHKEIFIEQLRGTKHFTEKQIQERATELYG